MHPLSLTAGCDPCLTLTNGKFCPLGNINFPLQQHCSPSTGADCTPAIKDFSLKNDYSANQNFNEKKSEKFSLASSSETVNICALEREANAFAIPKNVSLTKNQTYFQHTRHHSDLYLNAQ